MKKYFIYPVLLIIIFPLTGKYLFDLSKKNNKPVRSDNNKIVENQSIYPSPYLQVETSVYTHPEYPDIKVAAAITNFYAGGYTTGFFKSTNNGQDWTGTSNIKNSSGNTITTLGDPVILINSNGNYIMTYIAPSSSGGGDLKVGSSYSSNGGTTWSSTYYIPGIDTADKPVSETDNVTMSPYLGRTYIAYDELKNGGEEIKGVYMAISSNGGVSWDSSRKITLTNTIYDSRLISDIAIGNNGDVFVLWVSNRDHLGLARSVNGGVNWVINNDTAISTDSLVITYEYDNVNLTGVPSIEADVSGGSRHGWLYTVSIEESEDKMDLVLHRSTDGGSTWGYKRRINQDSSAGFNIQSMPSMTIDKYGGKNVFYYDTRNSSANDSFEVYLSRSTDGGNNFFDKKISSHKFRLSRPAEPLFSYEGYIGSYIGSASGNDKLTPVWYDNSSGIYQAYTADISIIPVYEIKTFPEGFYNASDQQLRMKDTLKLFLRGSSSPFNVIDSSEGVIDSVSYTAIVRFGPGLAQGNYYLELKHRNSIETWSADPVTYSFGSKTDYDFTISDTSAYGNNMKSVDGKWGIFSGDVDQNGFIDLTDVLNIYNQSIIFADGYIPQDCNGDSVADLSDILIAYNNSLLFVTKLTP